MSPPSPRSAAASSAPDSSRDDLTSALATRAVEAFDRAPDVAAIRQRLERMDPPSSRARPGHEERGPEGVDAAGQ